MAEKEEYTFGWETVEETSDFLKENAEEKAAAEENAENIDEQLEGEKTPEDLKAEEIAAAMFSTEEEDEEEIDAPDSGKKPEERKDNPPSIADVALVTSLKERGLLDFELEEGAELTPDLAKDILEDSYDDRIQDEVEKMLEGMPEEAKTLNRFLLNGGSVDEYINSLKDSVVKGVSKGMDLDVEANQVAVVRNQLEKEGFDEEHISAEIEHLRDSGRLEKTSEVYYKKWETKFKKEEEAIAAKKLADKQKDKESKRAQRQSVTAFINGSTELQGIKITKIDKKELPGYMTEKVTSDSGQSMTKMHNDLYKALNDPKKSVVLAKLLKSGFDFKSIKESAVTKKTKAVKKTLRRTKSGTPSSTTGTGSQKKTLAELLSE